MRKIGWMRAGSLGGIRGRAATVLRTHTLYLVGLCVRVSNYCGIVRIVIKSEDDSVEINRTNEGKFQLRY